VRRYLFIGPTMPDACDVVAGRGITLRGPASAGDVIRLGAAPGDVVGIVDGTFHHTRAVLHKEILAALADGVRVLGAASMGALRAAELDVLGMEGVGRVYRDYKSGALAADDEVTLMHGPAEEGYPAFSEPLVNLRATLAAARRRGLLARPQEERVIAELARRPYWDRSYDALLDLAAGLEVDTGVLAGFCASCRRDVKREDARELVDRLATARPPEGGRPEDGPARRPELSRTAFLARWQLHAGGEPGAGTHEELLRACQLLAPGYPRFHRAMVLAAVAGECAAACGARYEPGQPAEAAAVAHGEHQGFFRADAGDQPFLAPWLTAGELAGLSRRDQLVTFVVRSFRVLPGTPACESVLSALRRHPGHEVAVRQAVLARAANGRGSRRDPEFAPHLLPAGLITEWLAGLWDAGADDLELAALDRGFVSLAEAIAAARLYYLAGRLNLLEALDVPAR
jgi:hypothetical protein